MRFISLFYSLIRRSAVESTLIGMTSALAWVILGKPKITSPWDTGDLSYYYALISSVPSGLSGNVGNFGLPDSPVNAWPLDFPFAQILLGICAPILSPILLVNSFFILTFGFSACSFRYFAKSFEVPDRFAVPLALIFGLSPWHFQRVSHLFLVDISLMLIAIGLAVRSFRQQHSIRFSEVLLITLLLGFSNPYWMFVGWLSLITLLTLEIYFRKAFSSRLLFPVFLSPLIALSLQAMWTIPGKIQGFAWENYQEVLRFPAQSEQYAGKITSLLFPSQATIFDFLNSARNRYNQATGFNENANWSSLITIFSWILVVHVLISLLLGNTGYGFEEKFLVLLLLLYLSFFTVGGLGSVLAFAVDESLRSWNRLIFPIHAVILVLLGRFLTRQNLFRIKILSLVGILFVLIDFGRGIPLDHVAVPLHAKKIHADAKFIASLAKKTGCEYVSVYPYRRFPGNPFPGDSWREDYENYDNLLLGLYGTRLNYGAVIGTEADRNGVASRLQKFDSLPLDCYVIDIGVPLEQEMTNLTSNPSYRIFESPNQRWRLLVPR